MSVKEKIEIKLMSSLELSYLEIIDESYLHAGHREAGSAIESHFQIIIKKNEIEAGSKLEKHRKVNDLLKEFIGNPVHAVQIKMI